MKIPKTKKVKYMYVCPRCLSTVAAGMPWGMLCSNCNYYFNTDTSVKVVQDVEIEGSTKTEPLIHQTHGSIYRQIEDRCGVSHSALAEDIIQRDIPKVPQLYLALASKYMVRVGCKGDWRRDAEKALNYLTKALTGEWIGEGGSDDPE